MRVKMIAIEGSIRIPVTITNSDYQEHGGIRTPMRVEIENPASGRMVMTLDDIQFGLELGDEMFRLQEPATKE